MTYKQAFEKISQKLSAADTASLKNDFVIQVTMSDEDCGGTFYIRRAGEALEAEPYDYRDNDAAVDIKRLDFVKLIEGKLSAEKACKDGKLQVFGEMEAVKAIEGIVKPVKKPAAAKSVKAAPVKAAAEKTAAVKAAPEKKAVKVQKPAAAKKPAAVKKEEVKPAAAKKPAAKKTAAASAAEKKVK